MLVRSIDAVPFTITSLLCHDTCAIGTHHCALWQEVFVVLCQLTIHDAAALKQILKHVWINSVINWVPARLVKRGQIDPHTRTHQLVWCCSLYNWQIVTILSLIIPGLWNRSMIMKHEKQFLTREHSQFTFHLKCTLIKNVSRGRRWQPTVDSTPYFYAYPASAKCHLFRSFPIWIDFTNELSRGQHAKISCHDLYIEVNPISLMTN